MTRWSRFAVLAIGLSGRSSYPADSGVKAQAGNAEDTALNLAGRKIRVDKSTGKLRNLSAAGSTRVGRDADSNDAAQRVGRADA